MSVNSKIFRIVYHTDPNFSEYRYPFKIFTEKGLRVSLVDPGDREQAPMILGVDYEVTGVGEADGGLVRLTLAGLHKAEKGLKLVVKKGVAHQAHGDQAAIEALNAHKVEETAHAALFEKQEEALNAHNGEETAHAALFSAQAKAFDAKIRRRLTSNLTIFVRQDGNDDNDGSADTPDKALRTINGVINRLDVFDFAGRSLNISLGPGVYPALFLHGAGFPSIYILTIRSTDPSNRAVINPVSASISDAAAAYSGAQHVRFEQLKLLGGVRSSAYMTTTVVDCEIDFTLAPDSSYVFPIQDHASFIVGNLKVYGDAAALFYVDVHSHVRLVGNIELIGNPNYSSATAVLHRESTIVVGASGSIFTGTAVGKRFDLKGLSYVGSQSLGPNMFPGSIAGSIAEGSYYA